MAPEDSDTDEREGSNGEDARDDHDEAPESGQAHDETPEEFVDDDYDGTTADDPFGNPYPDSEREDPFGDPYPDPDRQPPGPEAEEQPGDVSGADQNRTVSDGFGSRPPDTDDQHRQSPSTPHPRGGSDESHRRTDSEPAPRRRDAADPEPRRQRSPEPPERRRSASGQNRRSGRSRRDRDTGRSFEGRWSLRNGRTAGNGRSRSNNRSTGKTGRPTFGPRTGANTPPRGRRSADGDSSLRFERDQQSALYSELHALEETMPDHHVTKPYLERVPDGYDAELAVMEWIEGLITTAGYDATLDALAYYRSIGWISTDVERTLEEHANTIARSTADGDYEFTMQDHRRSLRAIARIAQSGR